MIQTFDTPPWFDLELVRRHGGPLSHAALDPRYDTFRVPDIAGLIGFRVLHRCAVVPGDPVCPPEQRGRLADAFAAHCAGRGWSILYVAATADMRAIGQERGYGGIEFADLPIADPRHDPEAGPKARHLRQHLNHTRREGVAIREYRGAVAPDPRLEAEAEAACVAWRNARHGPQMYLGPPRLFTDRPGRRWFVAERAGRVIGMLSMLRVNCCECRDWINLVFATPDAPRHTGELLVVAALRALREEGAEAVCLGIGPKEELGRIEGFGEIYALLARRVYRLASGLLHPHGKAVFWEKFGVARRESLYLLFQPPRIGPRQLAALFRAFHFSIA